MITPLLLLTVAGLAALDAFNPATIVAVALILLLPSRHPIATALAFVVGAYVTVLGLGAVVFVAADAAADVVAGGLVWLRRLAFGLAAAVLLWSALRRLRSYRTTAVALPGWLTGWTALPLGLVVTGADLPNAVPYFIAIERLVSAGVPTAAGVVVLAGYSVVYCLPCLVLIGAWAWRGDRVRRRLDGLYARFGTARDVPRSLPMAAGLAVVASAVAGIAVTA